MIKPIRYFLVVVFTVSLLTLHVNPFVFVSANGSLPVKISADSSGEIWEMPDGQYIAKLGGEPTMVQGGITIEGTTVKSRSVDVNIESVVESEISYENKNGTIARENWFVLKSGQKIQWDSFSEKNLSLSNIPIIESVGSYTVTDYKMQAIKEKTMNNIFGSLWIQYKIDEGKPLKHTLNFTATTGGTFKLCQEFTEFDFDEIEKYDVDSKTLETVNADIVSGEKLDIVSLAVKSQDIKFEQSIKSDPLLLLPEKVEFKKDGEFILGEITSSAKQDFQSFEYDSIANSAIFCYGDFVLKSGESFLVDPDTYSTADPTEDGYVTTTTTAGASCSTIASAKNTSAGNLYAYIGDSDLSDSCYRYYMEFDTTSIPDTEPITNTVIKFEVEEDGGKNCSYMPMQFQPSIGEKSSVMGDILNGTAYVTNDATCRSVGDTRSIDLTSSADTDLQNQLSANWFAVGVKFTSETRDSTSAHQHSISSEESGTTPTPKPTLEVTYSDVFTTFDVNYFNGTALTNANVIQSNSSTSRTIQLNSTGMALFTGLSGNQNVTVKDILYNYVVNKTRNLTPDTLITINGNVYRGSCSQTGAGNDFEIWFNQTNGHVFTNMTRPVCRAGYELSFNVTLSGNGQNSANFASDIRIMILNLTAYGKNGTLFLENGTSTTLTYSNGVISANDFIIGSGTRSSLLEKIYVWLDPKPDQVTGLSATSASVSQIDLSWTAPSNVGVSSITGYKITRGLDGITFGTVVSADTGNTATTYSNTGLAVGVTYYYQVQAINSYGAGTVSSSASAAPTASSSGGGSSGGGGGGTITNNLQQLLFGLEIGDITTTARPADVLPLNIHLQYPSDKPIKIISIDGGEFDSWITHQTLPMTVQTDLLEVNDYNLLPPAYAVLRNVGDIPIQITIPQQYCNPSVGITQNCVEEKLYEIMVKLTLEFDGETYQQNVKITLDLRQQKLSPAAIQNMIIATILLGIAVGGITFFRKKVKGFEQSRRHKSRKSGLGKSKFEKEISQAIS